MTVRAKNQRGFGLFELLVALALVAISVAVAFRVMGSATRGSGDADRYTRALLIAESRMAELGVLQPVRPGEAIGEEGDYLWRVSVRRMGAAANQAAQPAAPGMLAPMEITVTVAWGSEERPGEVSLTTLRLAPVRP